MNIRVLNVPYDSGQYRARMGCGPDRLFKFGLQPLLTRLGHNFVGEEITAPDSYLAEIKTAFALCRTAADRVRAWRQEGYFPIALSGNCNTAVGTISGCGCQNTGVVWFDAHGESTTPETTTSGFLDGMGISILTGQCWATLARTIPGFDPVPGKHILLVGARDSSPTRSRCWTERELLASPNTDHLRSQLASLARQVDGVYLHIDLDVLDPTEAIANQLGATRRIDGRIHKGSGENNPSAHQNQGPRHRCVRSRSRPRWTSAGRRLFYNGVFLGTAT